MRYGEEAVNRVFDLVRFALAGRVANARQESKWFRGFVKESWPWYVWEQSLREVRVKPEAIEKVVS